MRLFLILLVFMFLTISCKKNKPILPPSDPSKAVLIFPDKDAACVAGTIISPNQNRVPFSWKNSSNTISYELNITNLITGEIETYSTSQPGLEVELLRNTPYSWYILSKSDVTTSNAKSEIWKFYNSGPGVISHAPFPPSLISPTYAQHIDAPSDRIKLEWNCVDVDEDLTNYDVYLGTIKTPALLKSEIKENVLVNVLVSRKTTYYWRVVAKDAKGNVANSELYQFYVN